MPKFNAHDKHVVELYKKAMIANQQRQKEFEDGLEGEATQELDSNFWGYLPSRLKNVVYAVNTMESMAHISVGDVDKFKREAEDLFTMVRMYTEPTVITQLMNEAIAKLLKKRMLAKVISE